MTLIHRVEDVAAMLQCKPSWLEHKAKRREIPVRIIGGRYAWTDDDIAEIVEQSSTAPREARGRRTRRRVTTTPAGSAPLLTARQPKRRKKAS